MVRLFIAIPFDDKTKREILVLRNKIRNHAESGRFTQEDHFHLTLVFLGEVPEERLEEISNIMNSIKWSPFPLTLDRMGTFQREGGDLYWLGCEKCPLLMKLQKELADRLRVAGFNIEFRTYMPHLTIGRQVTSKKIQEPDFPNILYPVTHFSLMESQRIGGKLIYTEIYRCHP